MLSKADIPYRVIKAARPQQPLPPVNCSLIYKYEITDMHQGRLTLPAARWCSILHFIADIRSPVISHKGHDILHFLLPILCPWWPIFLLRNTK